MSSSSLMGQEQPGAHPVYLGRGRGHLQHSDRRSAVSLHFPGSERSLCGFYATLPAYTFHCHEPNRWGNNQELYGKGTTCHGGMTGNQGGNRFRPTGPSTFLYESRGTSLSFRPSVYQEGTGFGRVFASYLLLYSFGRFMIEFLRVDDTIPMMSLQPGFHGCAVCGRPYFHHHFGHYIEIREDPGLRYARATPIFRSLDGEESEEKETNSHDTTPALGDNDNRNAAAEPVIDSGGEKPEGPPEAAESTELQDEDTGSDKPDSADGVE